MNNFDIVPLTKEHIAGFHHVLDTVAKERNFITFLEAPPFHQFEGYVCDLISQFAPAFVAIEEGQVVGWCDVQVSTKPMHAHRGILGMGLLPSFRGKGIGRRLLDKAVEAATSKNLVRLELTVRQENLNAIALYLSAGFIVEGHHKNTNYVDGKFYGTYSMALTLRET